MPRSKTAPPQCQTQLDTVKSSPAYLLQLAARLQSREFMRRVSDLELQPAETYVLHELFSSEPLTQSDLARRLGTGHASIGQTLRRLEAKQFITRTRDTIDRRIVRVGLTEKGRAVQEPLWTATSNLTAEILDGLGADSDQLRPLLSRLIGVLEGLSPTSSKR